MTPPPSGAPAPSRASAPASRRSAVPAAPPAVTLPPAFEAFYALHCGRYLDYALAHAAEPAASRILGEAMGEVAIRWADIVRRPNPAACAWTLVSTRIRQRGGGPDPTLEEGALRHRAQPALRHHVLEYDAFVLHEVLGYSVEDAAEAMGEEVSRVRYALTTGCRRGRSGAVRRPPGSRVPGPARNTPQE
ncbi:hypothetical protein SNOUR_35685 [Streptomyces noursei ATCC 11455]|uniref:hypothetical protein n=1 Tax=Streptomyces noursei TaxID=1971 RepID=UPI00081C528F|nr:hypothetical protein SNOUR_35685 [Streptomyces noursei ATCC 11455]